MSNGERALASLSTAVVIVWAVAYLAVAGSSVVGSAPSAPSEPGVAVLPPPELPEAIVQAPTPAPPEPVGQAPTPEPSPEAAADSAPEPVGDRGLELGRELLASGGAFPALNASYERFGSFREYARSMIDLGARFVVVKGNKIVAAADIEAASVAPFHMRGAFSPIPRDYSSEPALADTARAARREHGANARVQMLLPRPLDTGLFGGIAEVLEARGESPAAYSEILGRYEPSGSGGVWFHVEAGTRNDGSRVRLSRTFDLSALARSGEQG